MDDFLKSFLTLKKIIISDELASEYMLELLCLTNIACELGITSAVAEKERWLNGDFGLEGENDHVQEAENTEFADGANSGKKEECDRDYILGHNMVMVSSDKYMLKTASEKGLATVGIYEPGTEPDMDMKCDILVEGMDDVDVYFLDRISKRKEKLPWITAVTERTYLREMTLSDLDRLYEIYAEHGMTDYVEDLFARDEEEEYIKHYIDNMYFFYGYGMWLVCLKDTGEIIGRAGIEQRNTSGDTLLEMGYLISARYQHQGYASEVIDELIRFAKDNLYDFDSINVFIRPGNDASVNLIKHKGFEDAGCGEGDVAGLLRFTLRLE